MDLSKIELRKEKVINLMKNNGISGQKAQVVFVLDYSGSMSNLYKGKQMQELTEKLFPAALVMDDNGEMEFYFFHDSFKKMPSVTLSNIEGYIDKERKKMGFSGTNYSPVIREIISEYGGKKPLEYPVFVIFITDGDNGDKRETENAIKDASNYGIFFQFIGIGDTGNTSFPFLEKLDNLPGRLIDNANFASIKDISNKPEDGLYSIVMREYPKWIKEAKNKGLIK